jgi:hypothetical protein
VTRLVGPIAGGTLVIALATIEPASAQVLGACNTPVSQRTGEIGCYLAAREVLDALPPEPVFWRARKPPAYLRYLRA